MIDIFDDLDELYHHAKFGEDRTTRAGCRCEKCGVCLFFVCNAPSFARVGHILNSYCVAVYGSILILFHPFSEVIALSESLDLAPQFSKNCGQKL